MRASHPDGSPLSPSLWGGLVPSPILVAATSWSWQGDAGVGGLRSLQPHQGYGTKLGAKGSRRLRRWGCPSVVLGMSGCQPVPAPCPHLYAPVPFQSGCFESPSAVLCHPATPSRCSPGLWLSIEHHLLLVSSQASSWQSPPAQPGRELHRSVCGTEPCPQPV